MDENLCTTIRSIQLPARAHTHTTLKMLHWDRWCKERERKNHGIIMKIVLIWEGVSFHRQRRSTQQKENKNDEARLLNQVATQKWQTHQHRHSNHVSMAFSLWNFLATIFQFSRTQNNVINVTVLIKRCMKTLSHDTEICVCPTIWYTT